MVAVNILAVGDVCGKTGVETLERTLPALRRLKGVSFCVVNGENCDGMGISPANAESLLSHGADVITLGNHTWGQRSIINFLDDNRYILRPSNYAPGVPGRGWGIFDSPFGDVFIANLLGRHDMPELSENPFFEVDRLLGLPEVQRCRVKLTDFHAEATSEKLAMGYYLSGRVTAVWGTHTHVQTSDAQVRSGTGYVTDIGMTGASNSILGIEPEQALARFLGQPRARMETAPPPGKLEGVLLEVDAETGKCIAAEAIRIE